MIYFWLSRCSTEEECSESSWVFTPNDSLQKLMFSFQVWAEKSSSKVILYQPQKRQFFIALKIYLQFLLTLLHRLLYIFPWVWRAQEIPHSHASSPQEVWSCVTGLIWMQFSQTVSVVFLTSYYLLEVGSLTVQWIGIVCFVFNVHTYHIKSKILLFSVHSKFKYLNILFTNIIWVHWWLSILLRNFLPFH